MVSNNVSGSYVKKEVWVQLKKIKSITITIILIFQFSYSYTSKISKSITIAPFQLQLHLYYTEPFVNYVACVADCVYE